MKVEPHHIYTITLLRRKAYEYSRNMNLSFEHRRDCKAEHKTFTQIETILEELLRKQNGT